MLAHRTTRLNQDTLHHEGTFQEPFLRQLPSSFPLLVLYSTMRWPWQSDEPPRKKPINWADSLNATDWEHYTSPQTVIPTIILTGGILFSIRIYRLYLRRIPGASYVRPGAFRKRSIFGKVTRVGDGDNFHLYHTPGGRLTGWGWLRQVPTKAVDLKKRTIAIRIAGVDAPEAAHFGNEAQPYSKEALDWLQNYIMGRRVRARIYKRDQYDRVVATVHVWKGLLRRDVGKEMLKAGWATVYDAKTGSEFGGKEEKYRKIEAWAQGKKRGMWAGNPKMFESPREYKTRTGANPETSKAKAEAEPAAGGVLAKIFGSRK